MRSNSSVPATIRRHTDGKQENKRKETKKGTEHGVFSTRRRRELLDVAHDLFHNLLVMPGLARDALALDPNDTLHQRDLANFQDERHRFVARLKLFSLQTVRPG
jgi:hypothetical protein